MWSGVSKYATSLASSEAPAFDPSDLTGLTGWWDATDSATVTLISGRVSQIDDKSGNSLHLVQGTASQRPVIQSAELNGLDVCRFSQANSEVLRTGTQSAWDTPTTGVNIFGVTRLRTGPGTPINPYPSEIRGSAYVLTGEWQFTGTPKIGVFARGTSTVCEGDYGSASDTNWRYWSAQMNADLTCTGHTGGVSKTFTPGSTDAITGTHSQTSMGGRFDGAAYGDWDVAEWFIVIGAISTQDRLDVESYFKTKYAL